MAEATGAVRGGFASLLRLPPTHHGLVPVVTAPARAKSDSVLAVVDPEPHTLAVRKLLSQ